MVAATPLPRGHWAPPDMILRFWQMTLRPLRNDRCDAVDLGKDIYHMASVTANDMENCVVAPHPDLKMSHVLLHGEDGFYEWTPTVQRNEEKTSASEPTLLIGLGETPVVCAETRVPEEFDPLLPFVIIQTQDFFYIRQGLTTRAIPRVDKTQDRWQSRPKKSLTLSFSGLVFNVKYIETTKVEITLADGLK